MNGRAPDAFSKKSRILGSLMMKINTRLLEPRLERVSA
jgi:hypothetical protein